MAAAPSTPGDFVERLVERWLFRGRWLLAPFFLGLLVAILLLLIAFAMEVVHALTHLAELTPTNAILISLSLIDLALTASLVLVVMFAGYENFVSRIDAGTADRERQSWIGATGFTALKMKLIASIVAITSVALLRSIVRMAQGDPQINEEVLIWGFAAQLAFVVSGVLLALMDYIGSKTKDH